MGITQDITGQRFGLLVAVEIDRSFNKTGHYRGNKWICKCDCGKTKSCLITNLTRGLSASCGCKKGRKPVHGLRRNPVYNSWHEMIRRCEDPRAAQYKNYGGRGITVCERWHKLENFYEDMGERPPGKSIDRKDNNKGYYKENCQWSTCDEQNKNKNNNVKVSFNNQNRTISEWSRITGIDFCTLRGRLKAGWGAENALSIPPSRKNFGHNYKMIPAIYPHPENET